MGRMVSEEEGYSASAVAKIVGLTERQVRHWADLGITVPTGGTSNRPRYTVRDVARLRFLVRLYRSGWSTQKLKRAIEALRTITTNDGQITSTQLVTDGALLIAMCQTKAGDQFIRDVTNGGQLSLSLVLETIPAERIDAVDT
jgi:DNA-binding transcriptional MerR regulator